MIVGAMLTSLIIAREYENGTMETILSLPIRAGEFLTGKAIPYFLIGITDVFVAVFMGQILFGIVMRSNFWLMVLASSLYLLVALSLGLLISIVTKSQLVANICAVLVTYLPSLLLSDFCLSGCKYAHGTAAHHLRGACHLFYRYIEWPVFTEYWTD